MPSELSPLDAEGIHAALQDALADIEGARSPEELKSIKNRHLGEDAPLTQANKGMRNVPADQRAAAGKRVGQAKKQVSQAFSARLEALNELAQAAALASESVDVTQPTDRRLPGARHPLDTLMEQVSDFFISMGWDIAEGPEIEHEWFNFDALNFDIDHPARQMQDTFYVAADSVGGNAGDRSNLVMRTHTSPVQARVLLQQQPPVYVACPGKVFRSDELDSTHTPVFHQIEGLAVDKNLSLAHLKGTLDHFARHMFGPEAKTRLRPSFFPFTEPSAEMDLWFPQKKGGPGWIEWGGCGMVNPNVLIACGIDPQEFSGFAFGMGIERTLMLQNGIADMHDIVEGDIRFSSHFGTTGRGA
ncbi:MAG: phenylalanine--tRNA ligase subunit alpha [Actinomycetaceae bacterium]|nr:phenylalanine--tRNA ligase subunit alpha [Actinomycetaceae bacterium]